jgi:hypothetical protein
LKLLLDAYPECTDRTDKQKRTPSELLKVMLGEKTSNDAYKMFLHCVCSRDFCNAGSVDNLEKLVRLLLDACPGCIDETDEESMIPLHRACANADSEEVLKCLVHLLVYNVAVVPQQEIGNANATDTYGRTPLHILFNRTVPEAQDASGKQCSDVIEFIFSSGVVEYLVDKGADVYVKDEAVRRSTFLLS